MHNIEKHKEFYTQLEQPVIEAFWHFIRTPDIPKQFIDCITYLWTRILNTPASISSEYHSCYSGGLITHCVYVTSMLLQLRDLYANTVPQKSCILVGIGHDLGKVGNVFGTDYYKKVENGLYEVTKTEAWYNTQARGLSIMSYFGVPLVEQEIIAITDIYNLGNRRYESPDLVFLSQIANAHAERIGV